MLALQVSSREACVSITWPRMSSAPRRKIYLTTRSVCSIRLFARLRADRRMPDPRPCSLDCRASERLSSEALGAQRKASPACDQLLATNICENTIFEYSSRNTSTICCYYPTIPCIISFKLKLTKKIHGNFCGITINLPNSYI